MEIVGANAQNSKVKARRTAAQTGKMLVSELEGRDESWKRKPSTLQGIKIAVGYNTTPRPAVVGKDNEIHVREDLAGNMVYYDGKDQGDMTNAFKVQSLAVSPTHSPILPPVAVENRKRSSNVSTSANNRTSSKKTSRSSSRPASVMRFTKSVRKSGQTALAIRSSAAQKGMLPLIKPSSTPVGVPEPITE